MTPAASPPVALPLLADPAGYNPHTVDLIHDAEARRYWIEVFEHHLRSLRGHAVASEADLAGNAPPDAEARADRLVARFQATLDRLKVEPGAYGPLNILRICRLREEAIREAGFSDAYRHVKASENDAALDLLPDVLAELDGHDADRLEALVRGVFAGNVFDLGAKSTTDRFESDGFDFRRTRREIDPRPWVVDDFDALASRWNGGGYRKAVVFVDNAGADVVLGMLPLCRELARRGATVVMTANSEPALNDITIDELRPVLDRAAAVDAELAEALGDGRLVAVPSGNDAPLIDLRGVSPELAAAAGDADLLILEGMGRAIETNFHARFTCDTLKLAVIKEEHLARMLGGRLYGAVCRFDAGW